MATIHYSNFIKIIVGQDEVVLDFHLKVLGRPNKQARIILPPTEAAKLGVALQTLLATPDETPKQKTLDTNKAARGFDKHE